MSATETLIAISLCPFDGDLELFEPDRGVWEGKKDNSGISCHTESHNLLREEVLCLAVKHIEDKLLINFHFPRTDLKITLFEYVWVKVLGNYTIINVRIKQRARVSHGKEKVCHRGW